jgi:hypothetical protein
MLISINRDNEALQDCRLGQRRPSTSWRMLQSSRPRMACASVLHTGDLEHWEERTSSRVADFTALSLHCFPFRSGTWTPTRLFIAPTICHVEGGDEILARGGGLLDVGAQPLTPHHHMERENRSCTALQSQMYGLKLDLFGSYPGETPTIVRVIRSVNSPSRCSARSGAVHHPNVEVEWPMPGMRAFRLIMISR